MQSIKFTYCNDKFVAYKVSTTHHILVNSITSRGWTKAQIMILVSGARDTTHIPSMKRLEVKLKIPITKIKSMFKQMNIITTPYAHNDHTNP